MKTTILLAAAMLACTTSFAQIQKGAVSIGGTIGVSGNSEKYTEEYSSDDPDAEFNPIPTRTGNELAFSFNPKIGYFISDKFALGVFSNLATAPRKYDINYYDNNVDQYAIMKAKASSTSLGGGIFGTYYFTLGEKSYIGLETNVGYHLSQTKIQDVDSRQDMAGDYHYFIFDDYENNTSSINVGLSPSIMMFPASRWGIEFTFRNILGFSTSKSVTDYYNANGTVESPVVNSSKDTNRLSNVNFSLSSIEPGIGVYYFIKK